MKLTNDEISLAVSLFQPCTRTENTLTAKAYTFSIYDARNRERLKRGVEVVLIVVEVL